MEKVNITALISVIIITLCLIIGIQYMKSNQFKNEMRIQLMDQRNHCADLLNEMEQITTDQRNQLYDQCQRMLADCDDAKETITK